MWRELEKELDCWSSSGDVATLWWRDDDATSKTPELERLLDIGREHHVPLCLAVIPQKVKSNLMSMLKPADSVKIAIHGFSHRNHSGPQQKRCELPDNREVNEMKCELLTGLQILREIGQSRTLPLLVPPWNRVSASLLPNLYGLGFRGLSTYGNRLTPEPTPGIMQVNCHIDPIDWRKSRKFIGVENTLNMLISQLRSRRIGSADAREATGLLSHHAVWSPEASLFLNELFFRTRRHPATNWISADHLFPSQ